MSHMSMFIILVQELYESGMSSKEISEYLNVSLKLVENVVENG